MSKLVEGEINVLRMASEFSKLDKGLAAEGLREYVSVVEQQQTNAPDVLLRNVRVNVPVDSDTGRIVQDTV